jgi:hypothetical protein
MLTDQEAAEIAAEYLSSTGRTFFYKFHGAVRHSNRPGIVSVSFLWSDEEDSFTTDGPIVVDVDELSKQVLSEKL